MDRLVETEPRSRRVPYLVAQAGRRQKSDRARKHRRLVGQNVAEHVLRHDDVELAGALDQVHGHRVDQHMLELHISGIQRSPRSRSRARAETTAARSTCRRWPLVRAGNGPARTQAARRARSRVLGRSAYRRRRGHARLSSVATALRSRCPPVSSRTTRRSTLATISGFSGDDAASAGSTLTGRRFAKSPSSFLICSSPRSGRSDGSTASHFGPPTAPRSAASARRVASMSSARSGTPNRSRASPPMARDSSSKL